MKGKKGKGKPKADDTKTSQMMLKKLYFCMLMESGKKYGCACPVSISAQESLRCSFMMTTRQLK